MKNIGLALAGVIVLPVLAVGGLAEGLGAPTSRVVPADGAAAVSVLSHPNIRLSAGARQDLEAGIVDPRLVAVLLILADEHELGWVGPIRSGHSYYVKGTTRVSNHVFGRAADISVIDGAPVSATNPGAYRAVRTILSLRPPYLPDEVGSPWLIPTPSVAVFTGDHHDHIHLGWGPGGSPSNFIG